MRRDVHADCPPPDLERLIQSPFERLRGLLGDMRPGLAPIDMTIGEPRHPMPDFVAGALADAFGAYAKYPPIGGTGELRAAIAGWLARRYPSLEGVIDADRHVLPLAGSREGLFSAVFPAIARKRLGVRPAVLMPNPFYQAYLAAALAGGAEPVFLAAEEGSGFLPDLEAIPPDSLRRTAAFYLASPANPQGAVAPMAYLEKLIAMARAHDFFLFLDECYSEIYAKTPPAGGLEAALRLGAGFEKVLIFNSLSKRSNVPGLRSGFIAGDEVFLSAFLRFRNVAAPQMPLPAQHASALLWAEENHVRESRALYAEKFNAAETILGNKLSCGKPAGSFFLWPKVEHLGGGETAAKTFWKECGVKVLPGAYLAQADSAGRNPGSDYVRIALVDDLARTREALERLASFLS